MRIVLVLLLLAAVIGLFLMARKARDPGRKPAQDAGDGGVPILPAAGGKAGGGKGSQNDADSADGSGDGGGDGGGGD